MSTKFRLGVERVLPRQIDQNVRHALLAHPASVDRYFRHTIDIGEQDWGITWSALFGPQHGILGDLQDNMKETPNETDPKRGIPVYSLYGESRRLTESMLASFDVLWIDLQNIGCRIYTYVTTLGYILEDCHRRGKKVIVLDRPNPNGRHIEGNLLVPGQESFVGLCPMPMSYGLTLGEFGQWYRAHKNLKGLDYQVVKMSHYDANEGWPLGTAWINPSPNAATVNMAKVFPGTVILEGTTLSEGRGTTRALEILGAPDIDNLKVLSLLQKLAPEWLEGIGIRPVWFEPTFHKHQGKRCAGMALHGEGPMYDSRTFRPYRLVGGILKAIRMLYPDYPLWRDFGYEYVFDRLAIDVINGGPSLREWVDDPEGTVGDWEATCQAGEAAWLESIRDSSCLFSEYSC